MKNPRILSAGETAVIVAALQFTVQKTLEKVDGHPIKEEAINCRIVVTEILSRVGRVDDITTLTAAILHEIFDSSTAEIHELDVHFGPEVRHLVQELAGNHHLSHAEQMQDLLERASLLSDRAKEIILAESICRVDEIIRGDTTLCPDQLRGYLTWKALLIEKCRGANAYLEDYFDELFEKERLALRGPQ